MEFTGERVVPGLVDTDLYNEHLARYIFAEVFVAGKRVLDAGCGSGYGTARLAEKAKLVVGVDNSAEAIGYAREHYTRPKVVFLYGDCERLPFDRGAFDVIVSFEVIEHLARQEEFLTEVKRVLRPAGLFVLSTPNRIYYSEEREQENPYHHREFSREELRGELGRHFAHVQLLAQSHAPSVVMAPLDGSGAAVEAVIERGPRPDEEPHYFIGVCSGKPLRIQVPALCYVPEAANVLRERERHIRGLSREVAELKKTIVGLQAEFAERSAWALKLGTENKEREEALGKLQKEFEGRSAWALELDRQLKQREQALGKLQAEFEERTAWAVQLEKDLNETQEELRKAQEQIIRIKKSRAYRLAKFLRLV